MRINQKHLTKARVVFILPLAFCVFACSAKPTKPVNSLKPPDYDNAVITLERTMCYGSCPAYKLTIYGNGKVYFEGVADVNSRPFRFMLRPVTGKNIIGYAIAGTADITAQGNNDIMLVKTDANGYSLWTRIYGGPIDTDECYDMQQTSDGGYALIGHNDYDRLLMKTDANGIQEWTQTYETHSAFALAFVQSTDGGYALAGYTYVGVEHADFWFGKTDANGNEEWFTTWGGTGDDGAGNDFCYSIQQTNDGGYALAGNTRSFGAGGNDFLLIKTEPDPSLPPQNLVIRPVGSDIHLTWSSLSGDNLLYRVYSDSASEGQFLNVIGTTADTMFVDVNSITQPGLQKFYVVKAVRP